MRFSVLQSVYKKDSPEFLSESLRSLSEQTRSADCVVLVKDGLLTPELDAVISEWQDKLPLKVVGYEDNKGLAHALNFGLQFVDTDLVARMDSDDIAFPERFEKQVSFMESNSDVALCSSYIGEFDDNPKEIVSIRKVPLSHDEIKEYLKERNAFNHMAVVFRKSAVEKSGGYQEVSLFEDWDLWIRIVQSGFKTANLNEILMYARIGNDMIGRRHGFSYAMKEIHFFKRQLKSNFITRWEFIRLIILRIPIRLFPKFLLKIVYKILHR